MKLLITGGCGFLGSNIAAYGIKNGFEISVFDNLSRIGSDSNLVWLHEKGDFEFIHGDIRNKNDVEETIRRGKYDAIIHLAGQVAMTTSIINPYKDFEINTLGTINVLEAVRNYSMDSVIVYSSTNKVYGDLEQYNYCEDTLRYRCVEYPNGFDEKVPLDFRSPYGCSKGAADQYMLDYHRIFGLKTIVFRHSSMYGGRQFATCDQGWIGWFCQKALEKKKDGNSEILTISGNGKQVRDILHADDMVRLYYSAIKFADSISGQVFNIGGGMEQSLSLLELFDFLNHLLHIQLEYKVLPKRVSDQKVFVADIRKITDAIGWRPNINAKIGIENMIKWAEEIYR